MRRLPLFALAATVLLARGALAQQPPPPTSVSGTALMPPPAPPAGVAPAPAQGTLTQEEKIAIDNRFRILEARLNTDERIEKEQAPYLQWLRKLHVSGYAQ